MTNKKEILDYLKEKKTVFFSDYKLVKLGLFGSFVNGEENRNSDIDLIIEFQPNTKNIFEKKLRFKAALKNHFQRDIDLCREKYIKSYFKSQIIQSAIYV